MKGPRQQCAVADALPPGIAQSASLRLLAYWVAAGAAVITEFGGGRCLFPSAGTREPQANTLTRKEYTLARACGTAPWHGAVTRHQCAQQAFHCQHIHQSEQQPVGHCPTTKLVQVQATSSSPEPKRARRRRWQMCVTACTCPDLTERVVPSHARSFYTTSILAALPLRVNKAIRTALPIFFYASSVTQNW